MTYRIDINKGNNSTVFDIEFYLTYCILDNNRKAWYSELHSLPIPSGLIELSRSINEDKVEEFIRDCQEIAELRGELYEGGELWRGLSHNKPVDMEKAEKRHYHIIAPAIEERINKFCDKWDCCCNRD